MASKDESGASGPLTRLRSRAARQDKPPQPKKLVSGLLKTAHAPTKEIGKLTELNGTISPLLRLPPEIRNRIFAYALGGEHIQIFTYFRLEAQKWGRRKKSTSTEGVQAVYNTTAGVWSTFSSPAHVDSATHRKTCFKKFYSIAPLLVCRQIYAEACLLPYALNIFSFDWLSTFITKFLAKLKACQRRALRSLAMEWPVPIPSRLADSMTGIETVYTWNKSDDFRSLWIPRFNALRLPPSPNLLVVRVQHEDMFELDCFRRLTEKRAVKQVKVAAKKEKAGPAAKHEALLQATAADAGAAPAA